MHRVKFIWLLIVSLQLGAQTNAPRQVIQLNGVWQFEQSFTAFPPFAFTRNIPVPGLIHLASPLIDDYEQFFQLIGVSCDYFTKSKCFSKKSRDEIQDIVNKIKKTD